MAELLLELFSEEIPARMQKRASDDLCRVITARLDEAGLVYERAEAFATPRRLALVVDGLPDKQPDVREERRGPRVDAPEKAINGFLNSVGLTRDQVREVEEKKGTFLVAVVERNGRPTADVLGEVLPEIIRGFSWPKSMRWGAGTMRWVRPIHGVVCLLDGAVVPFEVEGVNAGNATGGHRFMAPGEITVSGFDDYKEKLRAAKVLLDPVERGYVIGEGVEEIAEREGLKAIRDEALLAEVVGLVEWPVVLMGAIDASFMDVPEEALIAAIKTHQKYLTFRDPKTNALAPRFAVVANLEASDGGGAIVQGNERVLSARLADTKFFWDQDRKVSLESRVPALNGIIFHEKLGSLGDKVDRIEALAVALAGYVPGADIDMVRSAARLTKADLTSGMVGEFPELQGIMGRYYAAAEGEKAEVAAAIADHYRPQGPNDSCPSEPISIAVALADKIDTLVGFFGIGETPTGSKDPFALRRAALGVIRLILENSLRLPLRAIFETAGASAEVGGELMAFFADRLKVHLRAQGTRHDLISAVFALGDEDDLVRLIARVDALAGFLDSDDGANLLVAYKRAANIVRIEEKKDSARYSGEVDAALLHEAEEKALVDQLDDMLEQVGEAVSDEDFTRAMAVIARLRGPVDAFFDKVTVNCDDPELRRNRLNLLSQIGTALDNVADFTKVEG